MNTLENQILTSLNKLLKGKFNNISIGNDVDLVPTRFPFVYMVESDNYSFKRTVDSASCKHRVVVYETEIYTTGNNKRNEAKNIKDEICMFFENLGFDRTYSSQVKSADASLCRWVIRFEAIVSKSNTIYRRT